MVENTENKAIGLTEELHEEQAKGRLQEYIEFFRDIIIILAIVMFIRTYVAAPFQIKGESMEESYHNNEFILVDKFSYADFGLFKVGDPDRWDVVVLRPHAGNGKEFYIKRVVGLPGDTIRFKDGEVFLKTSSGKEFIQLQEGYLSKDNSGKTYLGMQVDKDTFTVPEGQYWVMGDNRQNSSDSRSCFQICNEDESKHFVKRKDITGKVFLDFGYFNIFYPGGFRDTGVLKWTVKPRLLDTPKTWNYNELQG